MTPDDQSIAPSGAASAGFSAAGLADFNRANHALVDAKQLAGVTTLVARRGEIVNWDAYGVLDVSAAPAAPVEKDSIFRLASMTKPIVGAAMMILWEEGKWTLDDP